MEVALFLNGVFENVLQEIISAQNLKEVENFYLQPYRGIEIQLLKDNNPSETNPIQLLISTTKNLNNVCYTASIVGWENKKNISDTRLEGINTFIKKYQPNEKEVYFEANGSECVNLITIKNLTELEDKFSVTYLTKVKDNKPLKRRTRAGNWSAVKIPPSYLFLEENILVEDLEKELKEEIENSENLTSVERNERLSKADKLPQRTKILSSGFKRNPDVIVEVLLRANGICEKCNKPAPFLRAKDNTPFLEIHHKIFLANGGEDTVDNTIAVCPNCHRELHFGQV